MIDRILKHHLEPIARDHRRWQLRRTLALGWLAAIVIGSLFLLFHHLNGWTSPWAFLLLIIVTPIWTLVVWRRSRRSELDLSSVARNIEAENPQLHALLLTAVEQTPDPTTGRLNFLQERVIREALAEDRRHGWHARTLRRLSFARFSSGLALLLLVGVMFGLYRVAPPRMAMSHLTARGITVTPGDTSVEKGSSLVVLARFNGDVPTEATLVVRPANEPERHIPLTKNLEDPVFGTSLPEVKDELTYRVEYNGQRTRDFRVTTFEYPRLERADAKVTYPEYTGLSEKAIKDTRRISAVEGSTLDYRFYLNKPVKSATLVAVRNRPGNESDRSSSGVKASPDTHDRISLVGDTNHPSVYDSNLKLGQSARYELVLVDDAGRTNKLPPQFVFDVLTNRTPELKLTFPRGDQRVSALEELTLQGETSDDFGLKAYGIAYNLAGQETKYVELGKTAGPNDKRSFKYQIALESLGAKPDELLSYYLWADDVGPDGNVRRTPGDMYFAEVRPFEEIFREGQSPTSNQQQQQQQGQQQQNSGERLAELQKQIISATWNLQRRETGQKPSPKYKDDAGVVKDSQDNVLDQVKSRREQTDDPRSRSLIEAAADEMEKAADHLADATDHNSLKPLPSALSAEQSAYQALLRLASREFQVVQGRNRQGGQNSRGARAQRQLDQLDLRQSENRYETQSQASLPQDPQQRERLQVFSRLKELAQRQQDVNQRLKELQAALREARTDAERNDIRERLKRLQEEQRQLVADVDELRQRMDRPENQSQMSEARQQLDQTRSEAQRAADQLQQGSVAQALSSSTRAQRDLQQLRDDFRQQSSSQFADDMRQLRSQARELAQKEQDVGQKLDALNDPSQRKSLTDSDERKELASQLDQQKKRLDDLVQHATEVTKQAEPVEPLLAQQLYDTLRKASQADPKDLQDTTQDLLDQGRLYRSVYQRLQGGKKDSQKAVEVTAQLLRDGFPFEAGELEQRARQSINSLKDGVERAAQSVLGDDTEALRYAQREVEDLSAQLDREIARARQNQTNANAAGGASAVPAGRGRQQTAANQNPNEREPGRGQNGEQQQQAQNQSRTGQPGQGGQGQANNESNNEPRQNGQPGRGQAGGQNGQSQPQVASANQPGRGGNNARSGDNRGGQRNFFDQAGGADGGGVWGGPITGPGFNQWSDRLRDVEEVLDVPDLRTEAARIRDRARAVRLDLKRHAVAPKWDLVQTQIAGPLVELRNRITEELARRESKDALVPIDRDPVPTRYTELVRHYYENLGKSEPGTSSDAGGTKQ